MLAAEESSFNLSVWRAHMRSCQDNDSFLTGLNDTFCALHEAPHMFPLTELNCSALVEQLIETQFFGNDVDHPAHHLALRQLALGADELHHDYHSFAHVREVILTAVALIDRYEVLTKTSLSNDFKFNALTTALLHDIGHPGQKLAKDIETESLTLGEALPKYCRFLNYRRNIEPIILGVLSTAQPFFAGIDELNQRYEQNRNRINKSGLFDRIHPMAHEHILFTQIISMADVLPSLVSPERLMIGAMKFVAEEQSPLSLENISNAALGFLAAVEKSPTPFHKLQITIPYEKRRTDVRSPDLRRNITTRIEAFLKRNAINPNSPKIP